MTFSRAVAGRSLDEEMVLMCVLFFSWFNRAYLPNPQSDHSDGSESESDFQADSDEMLAVESSDDESAYGDSDGGSDESGSDFGGGSDESEGSASSSIVICVLNCSRRGLG
jgi:hypothetical protein